MTKTPKFIFALICSLLVPLAAAATEPEPVRPVTSVFALEYGAAHLADTYLTPLHYRGEHSAFTYQRNQAMRFNPERWTMQLRMGLAFDRTKNPAKNATMLNATIDAGWMMMHRWSLPHSLTVAAGVGPSLQLGCLYLAHNGNNPASAKAALTLDATAGIGWRTRLGRVPVTMRYQAVLPCIGAFFSPDYGQLYYQIYMGDTKGLCHAAWWGDYFRLDNLLTADFHFGNTTLRVGYHNNTFSQKACGIVSRDITHSLVIGVSTEWISIRPGDKRLEVERIISSF